MIPVMAKQTATDLEELAIHGDSGSADAFLAGMDGWRVLATRARGGPGGRDAGQGCLGAMFRALPDKYKRNYQDLRFYFAPAAAQDWHDTFADRGTALGDKALVGGEVPPYMGVPVVSVPAVPTNLDGILVTWART